MKTLENILLFVDDEPDLDILERALNVAEVYGAKLTVAAVVPPARSQVVLSRPGIDFGELEQLLADDSRSQLEEAVEKVERPGVETNTVVLTGSPLPTIVHYIGEHGIDYLIKAPSPSDGLRDHLLGSIDMRLMRAAPCLVGIGRARKTDGPLRAVVAVDIDENDEQIAALNRRILDSALLAQAGKHVEIYVIHAWDLYGYTLLAHGRGRIPPKQLKGALDYEQTRRQEWLDSLIDSYKQSLEPAQSTLFDPTPVLLRGDPRIVIPQKVHELDADIIGLGMASRGGLGGLLIGNTAEEILHRVNCTVAVSKPQGFESPFGTS